MRRSQAAFGSVLFLLVAPGVVAGLVPWLRATRNSRKERPNSPAET